MPLFEIIRNIGIVHSTLSVLVLGFPELKFSIKCLVLSIFSPIISQRLRKSRKEPSNREVGMRLPVYSFKNLVITRFFQAFFFFIYLKPIYFVNCMYRSGDVSVHKCFTSPPKNPLIGWRNQKILKLKVWNPMICL